MATHRYSVGLSNPTKPCPSCRGGYFYRTGAGREWHCHGCEPLKGEPKETLTVPGGKTVDGARKPVGAQLAAAVEGLPISAKELHDCLDEDDIADIKHGRIPPETLRGYAVHFSTMPAPRLGAGDAT